MEFFSKAFTWIAQLSQKLPTIDYKTYFIVVLAAIIGTAVIVALTLLGSNCRKIMNASKRIIKYLADKESVDDDNVGDFTTHCFSSKAPQSMRDAWVQFLGIRFGYPSEIVSEQNVFDKEVKRHRDVRANVFVCIALVLVAAFAFWGFGTLESNEMGVIHCLGLLLCGIFYFILVVLERKQYKRALAAFNNMQEDLDAKVDLQVERNYAVDSSPITQISTILDEIVARNTSKYVDEDAIAEPEESETPEEPEEENLEVLADEEVTEELAETEEEAAEPETEEEPEEELIEESTEETEEEPEELDELEEEVEEEIEELESEEEEESVAEETEETEEEPEEELSEEEPSEEETPEEETVEEETEGSEETEESEETSEEAEEEEEPSEEEEETVEEAAAEEPAEETEEEAAEPEEDAEEAEEELLEEEETEEAVEESEESKDGEDEPKPAKLSKLPNLIDYMLSLNMSRSMKLNFAITLLGTYNRFKDKPEEKAILIDCLKKIITDLTGTQA